MTEILIPVREDLVVAAFAKVQRSSVSDSQGNGALYKDVPGVVETAVNEVWTKIREVVVNASREGWDAVRTMVDDLTSFANQQAEELADLAENFWDLLSSKVRDLIRETCDIVLSSIRSEVQIGGSRFVLTSLQLQNKLVYQTSFEASLTALCKFVGSGETVVTGTYSMQMVNSG